MKAFITCAMLLALPAAAQEGNITLEPLPDLDRRPQGLEFDEAAEGPSGELTLEELQELPEGSQRELRDITTEQQDKVVQGRGAVLRALDRLSGDVQELQLGRGETARYGGIDISLGDCRYPEGNPTGDAYAYLVIRRAGEQEAEFQGWMIASSPALNALDDQRYDVWALRCMTS